MFTRLNPEKDKRIKSPGISDLENENLRLLQIITDNEAKTQAIVKKNSDVNKTLFAISNAVNTTSNLDELFESIHASLGRIMELPNFYIALYHKEKDCITIPYYEDSEHKNWKSLVIENVSNAKKPSSTGCVIKSGKSLLYNRYNYTQVCQQLNMSEIGVLSEVWMGTPLKINNEVIGVIVAQSYTDPDLYDENDLEIFTSVSDQVALAIERKRVEEALKQSEAVTRTLFSISNAVSSSQTLSDLYQKIHFSLSAIIDVTNFAIAIYDSQKDIISFPYMVDEKDEPHPDIENAVQSGVLNAEVIRSKKPRFLNRKDIIKRQMKGSRKVGTNPEQWLGVPLIAKNNVIGVLVVQSYTEPHLYNEQDLNVLVSISDQMAIAIDRKRAENELIKSEKKFRSMMESMTDPVYICSPDKKIEYTNPAMINRLGRDAIGESCYNAIHGLGGKCEWCIFDKNKFETAIENTITSPLDNRTYRITNVPVYNDDSSISKMAIYRDITDYLEAVAEKEKTQAKLVQSQKMESIGTLAGGIAHDFNNILSSIIGFSELALGGAEKGTELEDDLQEVCKAGLRARDLVKQILIFARQSDEAVKPIQIDIISKEVIKFIKSSIPSTIQIKDKIKSDSFIMGSPTQIHQVLMNLCTNAAYSMEKNGGILEVSLNDITIDSMVSDLKPGEYIEIKVTDSGTGISTQHIHTIFEPFFTTKPVGEGTGMGLAVVHGIIEKYGGHITVDSKIGKGTCFTIYLPITKKRKVHLHSGDEDLPLGSENILFVDDEASITKIGGKVLENLGYFVTTMTSSLEALKLFSLKPHEFDLIVTDMTMPNMTGDKLASELMKIRPDIPVILCTGYSKTISEERAEEIGIKTFLYKPIVNSNLAKTVRKVLDDAKNSG